MKSRLLLLAVVGLLAGCGAPAVAPQSKNVYDLDSPEGRAVMSKSHQGNAPVKPNTGG